LSFRAVGRRLLESCLRSGGLKVGAPVLRRRESNTAAVFVENGRL
jgi:hypothetical protein